MWRVKSRQDRGAMTLIVAIVVPVLLLGIGAIIVDVGGWYSGRAQDQNGADAAAIAVAQSCAAGPCDTGKAASYASGTSNGALAAQYKVCGRSVKLGNMTDCATAGVPENGTACPLPPSGNYVDVMVLPKNTDGSGTMTSLFGHGDQKVAACAQAQWGGAKFNGGIAVTISYCEWQRDTATGTLYAPDPPYPAYPANPPFPERALQLKQANSAPDPTCYGPSGGTPIPSGFGHTTLTGTDPCSTLVSSDGWYDSGPGNGNSDHWVDTCQPVIDADWQNQTIVHIPVFISVDGQGQNGQYLLSTLAAFVITAYFIQPSNTGECSSVPGSPYKGTGHGGACTKSDPKNFCGGNTCLIGYFVTDTSPTSPPDPSQNTGVSSPPKLTG